MKRTIHICLFIVVHTSCIGQVIKGTVVDAKTQKGIPNCSIHVLHKPIGVVSNAEGYFELHDNNKKDTLLISSIGYEKWKRCIYKILMHKSHLFNLKPKNIILSELVVTDLSPKELLKICLSKSNKFLIHNAILNTYYREYLKLEDTIKKFSDGMVDFFIGNNAKNISIDIKASRAVNTLKNSSKPRKDFYEALPMQFVIANNFPRIISPRLKIDHFKYYKYSYLNEEKDNNYYVIYIIPKKVKTKNIGYVKVFINKSDTLLSKVKIGLLPEKKNAVFGRTLTDVGRIKRADMVMKFRKINHCLYLAYFRSDLVGQHNTRFSKNDWTEEVVTEMMVNNIKQVEKVPFTNDKKYKKRYLYENGTHFTTPFWKTENIIVGTPEEKAFMSKIADSIYSSAQ